MRDYILETHPDKLELFDLCVKANVPDTESYWCYFESGKYVEDLYGEDSTPFVAVFKNSMNGFKLADEKVPYPSEEELLKLVTELHITGDDLKKTKWELLMGAYINGQA